MNETAIILASIDDAGQDATANLAIRDVASTPSPQHIIPADIVAFLYEHVDQMRAERPTRRARRWPAARSG